jgi:hypothetical protein
MALTIAPSIADVTDLAALSAALGPATREEVRALVPEQTDAARVKRGSGVATPRIDDDALRLLRGGAHFFATATPAARQRVNLSPEFLRVAAWSTLQGHDAWTAFATRTAQSGTKDATRVVQAVASL